MRSLAMLIALLIPLATLAGSGDSRNEPWLLASGKQWENLSEAERNAVRRQKEMYDKLPRSEQERIRQARERYESLPESQRQELRRRWKQLPEEEKQKYKIKGNKKQ